MLHLEGLVELPAGNQALIDQHLAEMLFRLMLLGFDRVHQLGQLDGVALDQNFAQTFVLRDALPFFFPGHASEFAQAFVDDLTFPNLGDQMLDQLVLRQQTLFDSQFTQAFAGFLLFLHQLAQLGQFEHLLADQKFAQAFNAGELGPVLKFFLLVRLHTVILSRVFNTHDSTARQAEGSRPRRRRLASGVAPAAFFWYFVGMRPPPDSWLQRFSRLLQRRSPAIVAAWLLLLGLSLGYLATHPGDNLETELAGATGTEAWQVREMLAHDFGRRLGSSAALVLPARVPADSLRLSLQQRFPQIQSIHRIESEHPHRLQLLSVEFRPDYRLADAQNLSGEIRAQLAVWSRAHHTQVLLTGNTVFQYDAKQQSKRDSHRGESIALLISLVILVLNFGSLSAALLPLLMGASSLITLNALIKVAGWSVNPVSRILASLVGLALGIDYALFIVSRLREEIRQRPLAEAVGVSLGQAGRTILYSGLIMLCSLSALLMPDVSLSRTVMQQLLVVIAISLAHALLVMPALMSLGEGWLSWPKFLSRRIGRLDTSAGWKRFSTHVVDHYRLYSLLSLLLLGALAWPVSYMRLWEPVQAIAPTGSESIRAYQQLVEDRWGGELLPVIVALEAPGEVFAPDTLKYLYDFNRALESRPAVYRVWSLVSGARPLAEYQRFYASLRALGVLGAEQRLADLVNVDSGSDKTLIYIYPRNPMALDDTRAILSFVRDYARMHPQRRLLAGGVVARVQDFTRELYRYTPWMLLLIVGGVYLLLWWHMKTLILPLKAAVMNFIPILASFGVLTLIFQQGWGHGWLHTPFNGAVTNTVPIVLFCIVFGLSMDYEVLILSRVSEEYRRSGDVRTAVIEGLARSGSVITGAVLILLGVFLPGCFSSSPQTQEICIGITVAILLDATIVRLFLVPSFMMLLGKWNWWQPGKKD